MSSNLRVNNILPSVGNNVAIGTAGGSVTLTGNVTGDITSSGVSTFTTLSATNIVGVSTLGVTTAYINTLSGISTIDASAAVSINQNLVFASGYGIDFSATANSSGTMTSELLDDYEEGTFTPGIGGTTAITYGGLREGQYVKIGQLVMIAIRMTWTGATYSGATSTLTGLPFTPSADHWVIIGGENNTANTGHLAFTGSSLYFMRFSTAGSYVHQTVAAGSIYGTAVYRTV